MEGVFGTPATGTADAFLEALGFALLIAGMGLLFACRQKGALA
jgi:LPXTG-motif cell wall-anchored protein